MSTLATDPPQSVVSALAQTRWLYYLYGIVEPGTDAHRMLEARAIPGLEGAEPVFGVAAAGLVAAVSRVPATTFDEEPLNDLTQDLARLAPFAVRHEEVVGRLARQAPALVPMSFGAVYRSVEGIVGLLHERSSDLARLLDLVRGCQEWGIKLFVNSARLASALARESQRVRALDTEIAGSAPGRAYLLRKQRSRIVAEEVDRLLNERIAELEAALGQSSRVLHAERPIATPDSPLVLKLACLVLKAEANRFRETAASLEADYSALGLSLDVSGPWAPYSFVRSGHGAD